MIPRSRYRPWIQVGRDHFGDAVDLEGPLSEALEAAIPDRFERGLIDTTMDYPWGYGHALLEAAVASATIANEPYDVASPSVRRVIDQFIEKIQATPATTVMQVVSDIDVMSDRDGENGSAPLGETLRVAGVDIIRVGGTAETYVEQELRSAGYDVERTHVVSWPGPTSLLVARVAEAVSFDTRSRRGAPSAPERHHGRAARDRRLCVSPGYDRGGAGHRPLGAPGYPTARSAFDAYRVPARRAWDE